MEYIRLGKNGPQVSRIGIGTVSLGIDYGIQKPADSGKPAEQKSIELLHRTFNSGINLLDTAPSYGTSEEVIGIASEGFEDIIIADKVNVPPEGKGSGPWIHKSLHESMARLRRPKLDIVQIHNATKETFDRADILSSLAEEKDRGTIGLIGASVYEPENALCAIESKEIDVLQVAYNILDQRMDTEVFKKAQQSGIGVIVRSVYLKGVLTPRADYLPKRCQPLIDAARSIKKEIGLESLEELPELALRFVLSNPGAHNVLVGVKTDEELSFALEAHEKGALDKPTLQTLKSLQLADGSWLNPSNWGID